MFTERVKSFQKLTYVLLSLLFYQNIKLQSL